MRYIVLIMLMFASCSLGLNSKDIEQASDALLPSTDQQESEEHPLGNMLPEDEEGDPAFNPEYPIGNMLPEEEEGDPAFNPEYPIGNMLPEEEEGCAAFNPEYPVVTLPELEEEIPVGLIPITTRRIATNVFVFANHAEYQQYAFYVSSSTPFIHGNYNYDKVLDVSYDEATQQITVTLNIFPGIAEKVVLTTHVNHYTFTQLTPDAQTSKINRTFTDVQHNGYTFDVTLDLLVQRTIKEIEETIYH